MTNAKCKKSVFCILFLFFFVIGTICGSVLFSVILHSNYGWLCDYCASLDYVTAKDLSSLLLFYARPLLFVFLFGVLFPGSKWILFFVAIRGCLCSYLFAAMYYSGCFMTGILMRQFVLLPAFYFICRQAWVVQRHTWFNVQGYYPCSAVSCYTAFQRDHFL